MRKYINLFLFGIIANLGHGQNSGCAPKMVLLELSDAQWCGPCVDHIEDLKGLYSQHKDNIAWVYYVKAPIGLGGFNQPNTPCQGFYDEFNLDYQSSTLFDRTFFPSNYLLQQGPTSEAVENYQTAYNDQINSTYVPVSIDIQHTYNETSREVNLDITGNFCDTASGDLRFYVVVVQDTLIGQGIDYAQNTMGFYQAQSYGYTDTITDPSIGGLWINQYHHMQVVKVQPSGFYGNQGVISNSVTPGTSFHENYQFILPEFGASNCNVPFDAEHAEIIVAVVRKGAFQHRQVLNVNKVKIAPNVVNIDELEKPNFDFSVGFNPIVNNILSVNWKTSSEIKGEVMLFDASGNLIKKLENNLDVDGNYNSEYNVEYLPSGIYFVGFKTIDGKQYTRKIVKQ